MNDETATLTAEVERLQALEGRVRAIYDLAAADYDATPTPEELARYGFLYLSGWRDCAARRMADIATALGDQ